MRVLRLDLDAFGPFTGARLDFGSKPALHVVHGRNEAGKSTALRALGDLLYGIDHSTRDAHLHPYGKLRIGAVIERGDGTVIEVVRRKGRKNTLLGRDGSPVDEAVLRVALGGVGRELFETVFGLSQQSLRSGGQALLEGRGDVGESLFDAGLGGRGIHSVLERLEREADALFTSRGQVKELNKAITAYKEAKREVADEALSGSAWETKLADIARSRARKKELDGRLGELLEEQRRVQRHVQVIPRLEQWEALLARRTKLGEVPRLPEDAAAERVDATRRLESCDRQIAEHERDIAKLEQRRDGLEIPASLVDLPDFAARQLADRLGAYRTAASDRPKREAELAALEEDALAILRRMGREPALEAADELRVGPDRLARIRALANEHSGLVAGLRAAEESADERRARLAEVRARLDALPPEPETGLLARAVDQARRLGDVDERVATVRRAHERARAAAESALETLRPWRGGLAAVMSLAVPSPDTVVRFTTRFDAIEREREKLAERSREVVRRAGDRAREIDALEAAGELPTEEHLGAARRDRDGLWARIVGGADPTGPDGQAFDGAVRRADELSDRLRREAERVAKHCQLRADLRAAEREREKIAEALGGLDRRERELGAEWEALLRALGMEDPLPPGEMHGWLRRVEEVRRLGGVRDAAAVAREELEARVEASRGALLDGLRAAGHEPPAGDGAIGVLVDRATAVLESARRLAEERRGLDERAKALAQELAAAEPRAARCADELAAWRESWAAAVEALGLSEDVTVEEAGAVLEALSELFRKVDAAAELRRRIDGMRRDADLLDRDSAEIAARHLPEVAGLAVEERVEELVRRHERMRSHLDRREAIDEDLAQRREALEARRLEREDAERRLEELMRLAGAGDLGRLVEVEERAAEVREVEARIREVETQLVELGDGRSVPKLVEETREVDLIDAKKRRSLIEDEIEETTKEYSAVSQELGGDEHGLEMLRQRSAADAADEAQAHLATVRDLARRYARVRLAAAILRREIERYREDNQGPILSRAGELFPRLTLGSFSGLRAGFAGAEQPVLECVRADGTGVDVEGLSNGTRDQLYLALRLATLEHHAAHAEPMPFVLDDVLVDFDDDRSRAALAVLGEVTARTQVILFTHHARVVELAREAVGARLVEHDLDALRTAEPDQPRV